LGLSLFAFAGLSEIGATDTKEAFDPDPLRKANTSSPRDTLRSFLNNVEVVVVDSKRGDFSMKTARAFLRAAATLNLSTTPHRDAHEVRTARVLMLKEILDRIELPPDDEIPGAAEVGEDAITRWTIPSTSIEISRIESGPREGMFLFSADTVQRLHRLYADVKHLPYKPGISDGLYEGWLRSVETGADSYWKAGNRLSRWIRRTHDQHWKVFSTASAAPMPSSMRPMPLWRPSHRR
jgi:MscS family membrane protein